MTFWTMLCPNGLVAQLILAHVFSASRQHHEVWGSQFPFLHSLKDVIPPSKACLYGHGNWSLPQAQSQSSMGLSQSFCLKEMIKPDQRLGSISMYKKRLVLESGGTSLAQRQDLENRIDSIQIAGSLLVVMSLPVLLMLRRRGPLGSPLLMCHSAQPTHHSHLQFCRLVCLPIFGSIEKHYFQQVYA